jgi:hypothetical protein
VKVIYLFSQLMVEDKAVLPDVDSSAVQATQYAPTIHVKQIHKAIDHILAFSISPFSLLDILHMLRMALLYHSVRLALSEEVAERRGRSAGGMRAYILLLGLDQRKVRDGRRVRHGLYRRPRRGEVVHGARHRSWIEDDCRVVGCLA